MLTAFVITLDVVDHLQKGFDDPRVEVFTGLVLDVADGILA